MSTEELQAEQQFINGLYARLDDLRERAERGLRAATARDAAGTFQARIERDILVAEQAGLLSALNSVESGLCFGRIDMDHAHGGSRHHIGRIGLRADDAERTPIVIDWRAPMARPFYLATGHEPKGLSRRRHLTTKGREVVSLHDEILDLSDATRTGHESHDADEVLLASLDAARTGRMHDIVGTIQTEQDRIIRAPHQGVLVVEGGPGTGKTAVALHRAAYLLYAHRESLAKRAVLIVGPNPAFLGYIGEVLPSLGETGVLLATTGELYPGVTATGTDTQAAAEVKGRAEMAEVLARFVQDRQLLPEPGSPVEIDHEDHGVLTIDRQTADEARERARDTGLPHNLARPHFVFRLLDALTAQLVDRIGHDPYGGPNLLGPDDRAQLGKEVVTSREVHEAIGSLWPDIAPEDLVRDFLSEPDGYLTEIDAVLVRRPVSAPWTPADIPLLDEAAELLGHDDSAEQAAAEAERQERITYAQGVLEVSRGSESYEFEDEENEFLAAHDVIDAERMAERHEEADYRSAAERAAADRTWAFGHVIVDEAQELSAMAWRLLMRRCPTRSMTLVGDPAQTADSAGCGSWENILGPYMEDRWELHRLGVNYRTPAEIMEVAAERMRAAYPGFEPPRSIRSTGEEPWTVKADAATLARTVGEEVTRNIPIEGRLAVIAPRSRHPELASLGYGAADELTRSVVLIDPREAKGLEFDSVIVVDPDGIRAGSARGVNDLYVALTRPTRHLGIIGVQ